MAWWYEYKPNIEYLSGICPSRYISYLDTYVPMVWDDRINVNDVMDGAEYILGYNEPNHVGQSNMTPHEAVLAWSDIESIANGRLLVSPSAAPCGGDSTSCLGNRDEWFYSFFEECGNRSPSCQIDFLATHTYMCNANQVMRHLERLYQNYTLPIWLKEFACGGEGYDEIDNLNFMKEVLPRLEASPFVFRYSWYKARISTDHYVKKAASLLDPLGSSTLTNLGIFYNGFSGTEKVDGVWSEWSDWGDCSVSCELGQRSRSRTCIFPDLLTTDLPCIGDDVETMACNLGTCPVSVDGVWGDWGQWSDCGVTCGEGQRSRTRECIFPDPANMGAYCSGVSNETEICNIQDCPVDGVWGDWEQWSDCGATCGEGQRSRSRECIFPDPANKGANCSGVSTETETCNIQSCPETPVDGVWGEWGEWSACGATCGDSQRSRTRVCIFSDPANPGADCIGLSTSYETCNIQDCPEGDPYWGEWVVLQCSENCGKGIRTSTRFCLVSGVETDVNKCKGKAEKTTGCKGLIVKFILIVPGWNGQHGRNVRRHVAKEPGHVNANIGIQLTPWMENATEEI
ncbi:properdin-like [Ruditapes philippinarum]|uniref:properdin-like n=1 Tax=Ruditapes philippinarum TaxID=129788 RepID=UPI00295B6293|nr:properdin-like [Ruditapes philippinarum]